ncbi:MAG: hypothetical protein D6751_04385 [Deltaproteobacteria bacterium]|nr:MAG: hypothetical protein D6751_04385 [Deltaproteobacteria bacterium]
MPRSDLQQFSSQLAEWIANAIERDRLPFRKVERNPALLLEEYPDSDCLVLWINRASAMAGGLILLPDRAETRTRELGSEMARALGLDHFAVWGRRELTLHSRLNPDETIHIDWQPAAASGPGSLHRGLQDLLSHMKLRAITTDPGADPDPIWLANLLHLSLTDVLDEIETRLRTHPEWQQGEWARHAVTAPALQKVLLVICRMLALVMTGRIGRGIQPEKLEKAINQACRLLPPQLQPLFVPISDEPELPRQAAVRLHHLLHRLGQLDRRLDPTRVRKALLWLRPLLEPHWPQPAGSASAEDMPRLIVNPTDPARYRDNDIVLAEPALAAWLALGRFNPDDGSFKQVNLLEPRSPIEAAGQLSAALGAHTPAGDRLRVDLQTSLRLSWPGRRFRLPKSTLVNWLQLVHLSGQIAPGGSLTACLAGHLPEAAVGQAIWPLVSTEFSLTRLVPQPGHVELEMLRGRADTPCRLGNVHGFSIELDQDQVAAASWQRLACLLLWPRPLVDLLQTGELVPVQETPPPDGLKREIALFARSEAGRRLQAWGNHPAIPRERTWPLPACPATDRLERLANLAGEAESDLVESGQFEGEIAFWLGPAWQNLEIPECSGAPEATSGTRSRPRSERIAEQLLVDGLPVFPDHYLYDHYRPELKSWQLPGPLTEQGRFFATIELATESGDIICCDSEPVAGCLLLASHMTREVSLPTSPEVATDILGRCLADLDRLKTGLLELCRQENSRDPERLASSLWRRWQLPPWDLLDSLATFL